MKALLSCDVVYSAETFYDPRLDEAAEAGRIRTVRHVNPELFGGEYATAYWYPTSWRPVDHLPPGPVMPLGIPDDWIRGRPAGPGLALHVGGHRAAGDRNGTKLAIDIAQRSKHWRWRFTSQDGIGAVPRGLIARTEFVKDTHDRWELYDGCAVLLLPRRYGGQSLPVVEAAARGLAVVMPDTPPNSEYPTVLVKAAPGPWLKHKWIRTAVMDSTQGKRTMERLFESDELAEAQAASGGVGGRSRLVEAGAGVAGCSSRSTLDCCYALIGPVLWCRWARRSDITGPGSTRSSASTSTRSRITRSSSSKRTRSSGPTSTGST